MPHINNMFPSKYLKASDFQEPALLTVKGLKHETMPDGEQKWVVYFEENDRGIVLNKTNSRTLGKLYGPKSEDWTGHKIVAFSTEVQGVTGDLVDAIRFRAPKGAAAEASSPKHPAFDDEIPF